MHNTLSTTMEKSVIVNALRINEIGHLADPDIAKVTGD
jgi:hypothetical protein